MVHKSTLTMLLIAGALVLSQAASGDSQGLAHKLPAAVTDADYPVHGQSKVELGQKLLFDKILSGNRNISCGTCHHALTDTADGLSLPVGEGGIGLGLGRNTGTIAERVPRNAPALFNLGAQEFGVLFHDGRVQVDADFPSGCRTPAGLDLPDTLENVLACLAMFPVTSTVEMAGQAGENTVADAAAAENLAGEGGVWEQLGERLQDIPKYVELFKLAYPGDIVDATDITFAHAANAIAAFVGTMFRADNSPFDRYLRGDRQAMSKNAIKGMQLFYKGDSNGQSCADCHSGKFQTDHGFHAIAMPQIGPGKGNNSPGKSGGYEDFGRALASGDAEDILKFRTPTLRNIALTAPYGHAGAYDTLKAVVMHHMDAGSAVRNYHQGQATLPPDPYLDPVDFITMNDPERVQFIAAHNELATFTFTDDEVDLIIEFLQALTDPASIDLRRSFPTVVPSGLPVAD